MNNALQHLVGYADYLLAAKTKHAVHSPFLFNFVANVIQGTNGNHHFEMIEDLRSQMLSSSVVLKIDDFGAAEKESYKKKLSSIVSQASKKAKYARLLYRIIAQYKPIVCLELGTNVGISAAYQALALPEEGYLHTIEGSAALAKIAKHNLEKLGLAEKVQVHNALFDNRLAEILNHTQRVDYAFIDGNHQEIATLNYFKQVLKYATNNTIVIFDDINWSVDMQSAWMQIQEHEQVSATIDLYFMGIVFLRKELSKEHFIIRY